MTPLHRTLAALVGPRLATPLLVVVYAALLLMILALMGYEGGRAMIYLDTP